MVANSTFKESDTSDNEVTNSEQGVKRIIKSSIVGCIFAGRFVEKRHVAVLNEYRHIIKIDEEEQDVIHILKTCKQRVEALYTSEKWFGFTDDDDVGSPAGCSIWTTLPNEILGKYWFRIQSVHFRSKEVKLKLQIVRPFESKSENDLTDSVHNFLNEPNISETAQSMFKKFLNSMKYFSTEVATPKNILDSSIFLSMLICSLVVGGFQIIHYLLEYMLKLLHSFQSLIIALTPTCIALINALTNIIFGFYKLVAYLFKSEPKPTVTYILDSPSNNGYYSTPARYALPQPSSRQDGNRYRKPRSGVHITELK